MILLKQLYSTTNDTPHQSITAGPSEHSYHSPEPPPQYVILE